MANSNENLGVIGWSFVAITTLVIMIFLANLCSTTEYDTVAEEYPGGWEELSEIDNFQKATQTLSNYDFGGSCFVNFWRQHKEYSSEYLVACSKNGDEWDYYMVLTEIGDIYEYEVDESIDPPGSD